MKQPVLIKKQKTTGNFKQLRKLLLRAEQELSIEGDKQFNLVNGACILALFKYWNFSADKIDAVMNAENEIFENCKRDNSISLISLLDQECDIELTNREGVSYRDYGYLNIEKDSDNYSPAQLIVMRQNQKKWVEAQFTAAICLAVHRTVGWGFNRLRELMTYMQDIKEDYDYNPDKLIQAATEITKYDFNACILNASA